MTATVEALGPCGWCADDQWDHRQGKKGCKVPGCGCGKYEPPKAAPAAVLEVDPASEIPGELVDGPDVPGPSVCVGEPEPAQPGDVDLPIDTDPETCCPGEPMPGYDPRGLHSMDCPAYLATLERLDAARSDAAKIDAADDEVAAEIDQAEAAAEIERLTRERDGFEVQRDQAYERVDELTAELEQVRADKVRLAGQLAPRLADLDKALGDVSKLRHANVELGRANGEIARLRTELDRANAGRQHAQDALDDAIQTGTAAATNVLYRYDADQCTTEGCGSRYTVPVEHPHPLTPVTVLIVHRTALVEEARADTLATTLQSKESTAWQ